MKNMTISAKLFTGAMVAAGVAALAGGLVQWECKDPVRFLSFLIIAVIASRLKVKLPGTNSNMSVNLPFILLAALQLSPSEALAVAAISTLVQCLPKKGHQLQPVQVLFNLSTMAIAVELGCLVLRHGQHLKMISSGTLLLALSAVAFFLANTLPVASIISLSEGPKMVRVWASIFHLSFPYYVASAGVTSMVTTASRHVGWQIPLLVLPVMYAIYRSYQLYFGRIVAMTRAVGLVGVDRHSIQSELSSLENV
jgi:hypothetical protein